MTSDTDPYDFGTAWCPECKTRVVVHDRDTASHYERRGEVSMTLLMLACDHTVQDGPETVVGAAPGAPYAGPGVAVAATTIPRDLRTARAQQAALDHPYGSEHDQ